MAVIASDPIVVATAPETEPNTPPYSLSAPILTALPGDGFAVAWSLYHQPVGGQSGESETFLRLYDSDGDETATLPIDFPAGHIATSTAGTIALMGGGGAGTIAVQVFDFEGVPIAAEQTIFGEGSSAIYSRTIDLAAIPDGGYTAIWRWTEDLGPPASQLRIIGPDGMAEPTAVDLGRKLARRLRRSSSPMTRSRSSRPLEKARGIRPCFASLEMASPWQNRSSSRPATGSALLRPTSIVWPTGTLALPWWTAPIGQLMPIPIGS